MGKSTLLAEAAALARTQEVWVLRARCCPGEAQVSWAAVLLAPLLGRHADGWAGIGWGVVAAVFTAVLPTLILRLGEHRQYWGDRHVRRRQDRIVAAPGVMTSVITGTALLYGLDAPVEVTALVAAMVAVLLALLVIAFFWKVSVHSAVASGALTSLATVFGPWLLVLASVVLLIGWSCIRLRCHTVGQVSVGFLIGAAVSSPVFDLVR